MSDRPKRGHTHDTSARDLARAASREAVFTLIRIMRKRDASDENIIKAANSILDRGWGKPAQEIIATGDKSLREMSIAELRQIIEGGGGEGAAIEAPGSGIVN